jgi:glycosyltransferase involved in cell wall biosynthesis
VPIVKRLLAAFRQQRLPVARIAFNQRAVRGPWGGSSAFVSQLAPVLERRGYDVVFGLDGEIDLIVLVDPRVGEHKPFGIDEIARYKERRPETLILHRVNECDQRKATDFMDDLLRRANDLADFTVFISEWLRDYHAERWFDRSRPNAVVYNGADPAVFHPLGAEPFRRRERFRVVTHHWSHHALKGFDTYREIDGLIASGALPGVELWVIGNWPAEIRWKAAHTFAPTHGHDLAARLRRCHAYVTASLWEPCGMHHVEGAQCGLPLLYHEDGGGIVEAGRRYGLGFRDDVASAVRSMRDGIEAYRRRVFEHMPSGDRMALEYADIVQGVLCNWGQAGPDGARTRADAASGR